MTLVEIIRRCWRFFVPAKVVIAPPPLPPPLPVPEPEPSLNRAQRRKMSADRRALMKARMKFDKFVEPKGPTPVKQERSAVPKPKRAANPIVEELPPIDDGSEYCADHYDDDPNNPRVLYELSEFYGQFNFRDTILDQLERYWFYLDRMRHHDVDSYELYRQVGVQLMPYMGSGLFGKPSDEKVTADEIEKYKQEIVLPPIFRATRPSFGCVAYGHPKVEQWEAEKKKSMWPRFLYFTKYSRPPPEVQMICGGDIYKMTVWWDSKQQKKKYGAPQEFAVFVSRDGQHMQVLKTCSTRWIPIKRKRKPGSFSIPDRSWHIPGEYERWAKEHGIDVQTYLLHTFCDAVKNHEHAQYGDVRVQVHKDDLTAIFNIDARRMSYFFQDRDIELTDDGKRRRIFHVVRPQVRKDGTAVRMHYRGEREFSWAGYKINITVPGLDHFMPDDFNVGTVDEYWQKKKHKYMDGKALGKKVAEWIDTGVGAAKQG